MFSDNHTGKTDENAITTGESNSNCNCTYWARENGRDFVTDPNGDVVNLSRLTAYAEYGKAIHDAHAHHELRRFKMNAPEFIDAVLPTEHYSLDHDETKMVDGLPLVRPES